MINIIEIILIFMSVNKFIINIYSITDLMIIMNVSIFFYINLVTLYTV
jgi:hypothetical protein